MNLSINQATSSLSGKTPLRKFMFDRSFDSDSAAPVLEDDQPQTIFTLQEMEAAKHEAYQSGYSAGQKAMADDQQQYMNVLLSEVSQKLDKLVGTMAGEWQKQVTFMRQLTVAITRRVLPNYVNKHGGTEILATVAQVLGEMAHEPRLVVRVGEAQFDALNTKIQDIAERQAYAGKVILLAEPDMQPSDCRIEWADGGIERDLKTLWGEIDRLVTGGAPHHTTTDTNQAGEI